MKQISKKQISSKLSMRNFDGEGMSCRYIQTSKTRGLKLFFDKSEYNLAIKRHKRVLEKLPKLAPKIYQEKLVFQVPDEFYGIPDMYYGFKVEHAQVLCDVKGLRQTKKEKIMNEIDEIFYEHGFRQEDTHDENYGKIGNRYVCIDFGEVTKR